MLNIIWWDGQLHDIAKERWINIGRGLPQAYNKQSGIVINPFRRKELSYALSAHRSCTWVWRHEVGWGFIIRHSDSFSLLDKKYLIFIRIFSSQTYRTGNENFRMYKIFNTREKIPYECEIVSHWRKKESNLLERKCRQSKFSVI